MTVSLPLSVPIPNAGKAAPAAANGGAAHGKPAAPGSPEANGLADMFAALVAALTGQLQPTPQAPTDGDATDAAPAVVPGQVASTVALEGAASTIDEPAVALPADAVDVVVPADAQAADGVVAADAEAADGVVAAGAETADGVEPDLPAPDGAAPDGDESAAPRSAVRATPAVPATPAQPGVTGAVRAQPAQPAVPVQDANSAPITDGEEHVADKITLPVDTEAAKPSAGPVTPPAAAQTGQRAAEPTSQVGPVTTAPTAAPAEAAAPVAPPPAAPPADPHIQVARVVRPLRLGNDGAYEVALDLSPAELGRVRIDVELRGATVSLSLRADNPATRDLLQASLNQLRTELEAAGLHAGDLDVSGRGADGRGAPGQEGSVDTTGLLEDTDDEAGPPVPPTTTTSPMSNDSVNVLV